MFIKEDSIRVIDPEFAFYGLIDYDKGNLIANLIFAGVNADATMEDDIKRFDYTVWLEESIAEVIEMFNKKFVEF